MNTISKLLTAVLTAMLSIISTACLIFLPLAAAIFVDEASLASWLKTNAGQIGNAEAQKGYWLFICLCALIPLFLSIFTRLLKMRILAKISLIISAFIIASAPFLLFTVFFGINLLEAKAFAYAIIFLLFLCMQSYSIRESILNLNKGIRQKKSMTDSC